MYCRPNSIIINIHTGEQAYIGLPVSEVSQAEELSRKMTTKATPTVTLATINNDQQNTLRNPCFLRASSSVESMAISQ